MTKTDANIIYNSAAIKDPDKGTAGGDFSIIRYPHDLASNNHPHYVMFFINIRESDLGDMENKPALSSVSFDNSKENRTNTEGDNSTLLGAVAVAPVGAKIGEGIGGLASTYVQARTPTGAVATGLARKIVDVKKLGSLAGKFVGAGAGAAVGALFGATNGYARNQVLLKDVIALYLNGKPSSSFSASWGEEDLGPIGGIATENEGFGTDLVKNAAMKAAEKEGNGFMGNAMKAYEATTAMTPNPFKAQLFKNMKFRTFGFDYVFLPRNAEEYKSIKQIISTFKRYMHPLMGSSKYIMRYPAEFNISYYFKDGVNQELFRISNCALTDMTVEYGGTDFTTFKGTKGAPSEISMKLKFTELELLSQERFDMDTGF